jgi:hypothetical protein
MYLPCYFQSPLYTVFSRKGKKIRLLSYECCANRAINFCSSVVCCFLQPTMRAAETPMSWHFDGSPLVHVVKFHFDVVTISVSSCSLPTIPSARGSFRYHALWLAFSSQCPFSTSSILCWRPCFIPCLISFYIPHCSYKMMSSITCFASFVSIGFTSFRN